MPNAFSKDEIVMQTEVMEEFDDSLLVTRQVNKFNVDPVTAERTNDKVWVKQPLIATAEDGDDVTDLIKSTTRLSVPITISYVKNVARTMTATEYRDALQSGEIKRAALQGLASAINLAALTVASNQGTLVVTSASASSSTTAGSTGFDLIADCDSIFREQGIPTMDNSVLLSPRDYNGMASNLAARTLQPKSATAYEKALIGEVSGFDAFKMDYAKRCAANAATVTIDGANQYYTPVSTRTATTGETSNIDNRYQQITVDTTTGVTAGDAFTCANVLSIHHITKEATAQNKTFRVISVDSATTMTISPPMISNGGGTDAEEAYQNVDSTPADGAALTFKNIAAADINPFFHRNAMYLTPGTFEFPSDVGIKIMKESTSNGFQLCYKTWSTGFDNNIYWTWLVKFGITMVQPEMAGILLFGQT